MIYQTIKQFLYTDKACHILVAYTIMLTVYLRTRNLKISILTTVALSIFKEILDLMFNNQGWLEATQDLFFDLIGIVIAIFGIKV